jgi:glycosyltransferase involved in cell wall biosynthesis
MTSVSVVMPCYRYGHFLDEAVRSVLDDQPGVDVRLLIIDDASPDDSADVARRIAAADPRVEVLVHETNKGHIATYNEGLLEWADGDYTAMVSADDLLTPGSLSRAAELLDVNPGVGFVYGIARWFWQGQPMPEPRTRLRGWSVWPGPWWLERRFRSGENNITTPEVVVRTSVQRRVGGYDPRLPHAGDLELWLRLAGAADVGFLKGVDQALYRVHGKNMRASYSALPDLVQQRLAWEVAYEHTAARMSDPKGASDAVHRKLGRAALWAAARMYDEGRADEDAVDELVAFAFDCWPRVDRLPLYRTLQLRRRIGPERMHRLEPVMVSAFGNRAYGWLRRRGWKYRGY